MSQRLAKLISSILNLLVWKNYDSFIFRMYDKNCAATAVEEQK